jgi:hypothetical protein
MVLLDDTAAVEGTDERHIDCNGHRTHPLAGASDAEVLTVATIAASKPLSPGGATSNHHP